MKKILLSASIVCLLISNTMAAPLAVGTQELRLQGAMDIDGVWGTEVALEAGYGYFIADYLEIGAVAGVWSTDYFTTYSAAGFAEYNFELIYEGVVPFVGGQIGFSSLDVDAGENNSGVTFAGYTGVKFFATENLAITPRVKVEFCTDEIYPEEGEVSDLDTVIDIGLRYFF